MLTWTVENLSQRFYRQSETISLLDAQWRFALSYFKDNDKGLRVEIKLMNNPYDVKQAKEYWKKSEFDLPSNLDHERIDPIARFEVESELAYMQKARINELNA